jgi:hypothetical protein
MPDMTTYLGIKLMFSSTFIKADDYDNDTDDLGKTGKNILRVSLKQITPWPLVHPIIIAVFQLLCRENWIDSN